MADLIKGWDAEAGAAVVDLAGSGEDRELITAVINSLFAWRRRPPDVRDPAIPTYGFVGDALDGDRTGSLLYLLRREKLTPETLVRAARYARDALDWMMEDGAAGAVDVVATRAGRSAMQLAVTVWRLGPAAAPLRFDAVWDRGEGP